MRQSAIEGVAGVFGVSEAAATALLIGSRWSLSAEEVMQNDALFEKAANLLLSVSTHSTQPPISVVHLVHTASIEAECPICADKEFLETLECGHAVCAACWKSYLSLKILDEGAALVSCPMAPCNVAVSPAFVANLVNNATAAKYSALQLNSFVNDSPSLVFCPAPDCQNAISCPAAAKLPPPSSILPAHLNSIIPTVSCSCGHSFCFSCSLPAHQPAPCGLIKLWLTKCADDSETANWICANTKDCPKCSSAIEKNGGCNHMTCRKCRHEFCWICSADWRGHNCSTYEPNTKATTDQERSRASLERYLHYFNRYANHDQSMKLDAALSEKIALKIVEIQEKCEMSWIEAQFMTEAKEVLLASRRVLKWTYCFAFYLQKNNACILFETNQEDLEKAVESLSGLLERDFSDVAQIASLRAQVLDKAVYVSHRRDTLLNTTLGDLKEGKFDWVIAK
ncbi:IBR-domain-containing protein [Rhizoclosmatium globosum]|uniref:RBR-type E3 ubiquitin transferase n=1 Tax=Rhizoclosmatium globosum TaxID=329046 RepID=A0A1Y2CGP4_9FUNG|nr:IBR-domain-containing protein [Rhizoclosmatium globosum]|eukprot:ORY45994.1 IBR-domain-containing protein [Rhizoclosmatium globosum]